MKRLPVIILVLAAVLTGCKTNENNYRQAYEAAVAQREESAGLDSTIYSRIRNSARTSKLVVGADSLPVRTEYIGYTEDGGASRATVKRYNIVVGQFKQVFNAKAMRKRLLEQGYDSAFIVHTREPLYYVVTATCATPEDAAREFERVKSDKNIVLRAPVPFVLQPMHLAR